MRYCALTPRQQLPRQVHLLPLPRQAILRQAALSSFGFSQPASVVAMKFQRATAHTSRRLWRHELALVRPKQKSASPRLPPKLRSLPTKRAKLLQSSHSGSRRPCSRAPSRPALRRPRAAPSAMSVGTSRGGSAPQLFNATKEASMPVILWLLGVPLSLIILLMILR